MQVLVWHKHQFMCCAWVKAQHLDDRHVVAFGTSEEGMPFSPVRWP